MKKCLMLLVVLVLLSPAAKAQPPVGYIGLFTDAGHSSWCAYGTAPYYPVTMYICCLPSVNGQMCAEFAIDYTADPGIIKTSATAAPHVSVALGGLDTGMSVCFLECQTEWHWAFSQALFINTSSKLTLQIVPHPVVNPDSVVPVRELPAEVPDRAVHRLHEPLHQFPEWNRRGVLDDGERNGELGRDKEHLPGLDGAARRKLREKKKEAPSREGASFISISSFPVSRRCSPIFDRSRASSITSSLRPRPFLPPSTRREPRHARPLRRIPTGPRPVFQT